MKGTGRFFDAFVKFCALSCLLASPFPVAAQQPVTPAGGSSLISTWHVVHGNDAGKTFEPKEIVILKHVTGPKFTWVRYKAETKEVVDVAGGSSSLANGTYSEPPQYGLGNDFKLVQGKQQSFQSRLEGMNGVLRHQDKGDLAKGVSVTTKS